MKLVLLFLALFVATATSQTCGDGVCSLNFAENANNCPDDCDDICPCRPYCEGRECGSDGCGGSCGTCPFPRACNAIGRCECARNCIGKECGDDGCNSGDLCDFCGPQQTCGADFLCRGECTPNCVNPDGSRRQCGNDGCFGSCGECTSVPGQDIRCRDGVCVCRPQCDLIECGPDGCGGNCGACEGDGFCVDGFCQYPILGCCGDGICDPLTEDTCSCHTDCRGCCVDGNCQAEFGEDKNNCPADCVNLVDIEIRIRELEVLVEEQCSIQVNGPNGYTATLPWTNPKISWDSNEGGDGSYTFVPTCPSYEGETFTIVVTTTTRLITLYVKLRPLLIEVRDRATNQLVSTARITITAQFGGGQSNGYNWASPSMSWVPFSGFGSYRFFTTSTGYLDSEEFHTVTASTTLITLYLNVNYVPIIVEDCATRETLTSNVVVTSTTYASFSATIVVTGTTTRFTHAGYGDYTFAASATGYASKTETRTISASTAEVRLCLSIERFCGDGVCNGPENANPLSSDQCYDCGRLRGTISLAVGQKDQLTNITVSVWAHPTNPAELMSDGKTVPPPDFIVLSDAKGFFSTSVLSFDAARNTASGSYTRRFYFSLTGSYVDRTTGNDVLTNLLPLWWNYELTNTQWSGSGSLTGSNNSPNFYFFMTPPFTAEAALVRVILSWGNRISDPGASLPDLDLVVAGPVDQAAYAQFGSGVINFSNKAAHSGSHNTLPYAEIITDSAQGFGPEVFDFYNPQNGASTVGYSNSYENRAAANAYEVWVDRPNSAPNEQSFNVKIADTNAFIVVYENKGGVSAQRLFNRFTGVPYAYGFYNGDQWNKIPNDATLWHIIDISQNSDIVYDNFPAEYDTAGSKYSRAGGVFDATKMLPCGHVQARGANPEFCPFQLKYPQSKK